MNGTDPRNSHRDGARPRRQAAATPRRISWRAAGRIVNGQDGGRGTEDLRALIAIAAAPMPSDTANAQSASRDAVLTAFRESAAAPPPASGRAARDAVRTRQTPGALVVRFAAAVLLVCGAGVGAASVGVLPAGMQRIAHDYLGVGSVPAPSTHSPATSDGTSGAPESGVSRPGRPLTSASGVPSDSVAMATLCQVVVTDHGDWHAALGAADRAILIEAAGGDHYVKAYCTGLLANAGPTAAPSADTPSTKPSVGASATHGSAHDSHSPGPHSSTH